MLPTHFLTLVEFHLEQMLNILQIYVRWNFTARVYMVAIVDLIQQIPGYQSKGQGVAQQQSLNKSTTSAE